MAAKVWYPIFLDMQGVRVLVIGAGRVALRKVEGLLEAGAQVTVLATRFLPEFAGLPIARLERSFTEDDVQGYALVFAATDSRDVNRRAGASARALGIPANIADAPGECGFIVPARVRHGDLQIAVSTGGTDPSRAKSIREQLEQWLDLMRP